MVPYLVSGDRSAASALLAKCVIFLVKILFQEQEEKKIELNFCQLHSKMKLKKFLRRRQTNLLGFPTTLRLQAEISE